MAKKKVKPITKVVGLVSFALLCLALLVVPNALGQSANQQGANGSSGYTVFKSKITVGGQQVDCYFTVTDAQHRLLKGGNDHYVLVGNLDGATQAIDNSLTGDVVIPAQVKDDQGKVYDVTGIGDYAFKGCTISTSGLKGNKTVTQIGIGSYLSCKQLARTDLESSVVTRVNTTAFSYSGITDTGLANNSTLKPASFDGGEFDSTGSLGVNCFGFCENLKSTGLENNNVITEIPTRAFQGCINLKSTGLERNKSITKIGTQAFSGCTALVNSGLEGNRSVVTLEDGAFLNCTGLTSTGLANSAVQTLGESAFCGCSNLKATGLENNNSVTSIGDHAFQQTSLVSTGLSTNKSVKTIGDAAFRSLSSLTDTGLAGNSTIKSVGLCAFSDCVNIKDTGLNTNTGLQILPKEMFMNCYNLVESGLTQNKTVKKIEDEVFVNCYNLGSVSTGVSSAGKLVLNGNNGQLEVGSYAFAGTMYSSLCDNCKIGGLVTDDEMFGKLTSDCPAIIGLPAKSQIKTVYVPQTSEWQSTVRTKIGGVTYSLTDRTLQFTN